MQAEEEESAEEAAFAKPPQHEEFEQLRQRAGGQFPLHAVGASGVDKGRANDRDALEGRLHDLPEDGGKSDRFRHGSKYRPHGQRRPPCYGQPLASQMPRHRT